MYIFVGQESKKIYMNMDMKKIQEKARNIGKFTLEVLDDLFGKRVLIFAYVLAAIFAASALFQVFTKYVYEEGFSTADALVATVIHTFTKIWGGILYGVLPGFGVFVIIYVIAKCIRNKNLRLKAEADAVQEAEEAKRLAEERRRQEEEERRMEEERLKAEQEAKRKADEEAIRKAQQEAEEKARLKAEAEAERKAAEERMQKVVATTLRSEVDARFAEESARRKAEGEDAARMAKENEEIGKLKVSVPQKFGVANIEIMKKDFRALFSPAFRGNNGKNIDYCSRLESILKDPNEEFSTTELARLALVLYETDRVLAEKMSFPKWLKKFCEALSVKPPLETSKNKYRTNQNIAGLYGFANFSKEK